MLALPVQGLGAIKSLAERFQEMRRSEGARVTVGKSAIHGWGAFAKRPHAVGDMVLEYAGQVVRPSVAELRESRLYDVLVSPLEHFDLNGVTHADCWTLKHWGQVVGTCSLTLLELYLDDQLRPALLSLSPGWPGMPC